MTVTFVFWIQSYVRVVRRASVYKRHFVLVRHDFSIARWMERRLKWEALYKFWVWILSRLRFISLLWFRFGSLRFDSDSCDLGLTIGFVKMIEWKRNGLEIAWNCLSHNFEFRKQKLRSRNLSLCLKKCWRLFIVPKNSCSFEYGLIAFFCFLSIYIIIVLALNVYN